MLNEKVKSVLDDLVKAFKNGDIPKAIAYISFPKIEVPMSKWSFLNQLICYSTGKTDFRGFNQWHEVNRYVKKGSKAVHILVPWIKKVEKDDNKNEKDDLLIGFLTKPVFPVEATDGEELDYKLLELPELPLMEKAKAWGLNVKAIPSNSRYYGCYRASNMEIELATPEEKTFFHELAHHSHNLILGGIKNGQDPIQEIVAELSAQALCHIVGKSAGKNLGNTYEYIEAYASKMNLSAYSAVMRVLRDTEKVLNLILSS